MALSFTFFLDKKHKFRKYAYDQKRERAFQTFFIILSIFKLPISVLYRTKTESLHGEEQEGSFAPSSFPCPL